MLQQIYRWGLRLHKITDRWEGYKGAKFAATKTSTCYEVAGK